MSPETVLTAAVPPARPILRSPETVDAVAAPLTACTSIAEADLPTASSRPSRP